MVNEIIFKLALYSQLRKSEIPFIDVPYQLLNVCGDERRRDGVGKSPMTDSRQILRKSVSFALRRL